MDTELDQDVAERDDSAMEAEAGAPDTIAEGADDGGVGAAVAMIVALSSFLLAVVFVLLRHALFHA